MSSHDAVAQPPLDDLPTLASEMRGSALLLALAVVVVGGTLLLTRAIGA